MSATDITFKPLSCALVLCTALLTSPMVLAQQTDSTGVKHSQQPTDDVESGVQPARMVDGVLQLEATIRSSKEQPRVMSIVPWQLPSHKSVGQNQGWRLQQARLQPIERGQFLRELALRQQLWPSPTTGEQTYPSPEESGVKSQYTK